MNIASFALVALGALAADAVVALALALLVSHIHRVHQRRSVTREAERVLAEWKREHA